MLKIKEIYREHIIIKLPESMVDQPVIEGKIVITFTCILYFYINQN